MSQLLLKSLEFRHVISSPLIIRVPITKTSGLSTSHVYLSSGSSNQSDRASPAQLYNIEQALQDYVPKFFAYSHPYGYYNKNVIFVDNIRGIKLQGLSRYATRINLIKAYFTFRYSNNKMELLNLVKNPEESFIKVRWRIKSKPVLKTYLGKEIWRDGISTFHVDQEGKICSHICDNVQADTKESLVFKRINDTLIKSS